MNNKAVDIPIYGGFDRVVHCDNSSDYYDSFFQPEIKSADDLRAYCEKYKDQFPVLNDISAYFILKLIVIFLFQWLSEVHKKPFLHLSMGAF